MGAAAGIGVLLFVLKVVIGIEGKPTKDVVTEAGVHVLTGGVSTAGLLAWGAGAGAAALGGLTLRRQGRREESAFLLIAAAGIGFLGLDDALLFHEDVFPNHLGVQEQVTFLFVGAAAVAWAIRFRSLIFASDVVLLTLTMVAALVGVIVDLLDVWSETGEDWFKYVALAGLVGWVIDTSMRLLMADRSRQVGG